MTGGMSTTRDAVTDCAVGGTGVWLVSQDPALGPQRSAGDRRAATAPSAADSAAAATASTAAAAAAAKRAKLLSEERAAVERRCVARLASRAASAAACRQAPTAACATSAPAPEEDAVRRCVGEHPWVLASAVTAASSTALCVGQQQLLASARPLTMTKVGSSLGPALTDVVLTQCSWDVTGLT